MTPEEWMREWARLHDRDPPAARVAVLNGIAARHYMEGRPDRADYYFNLLAKEKKLDI